MNTLNKAVFLDRDGVINEEVNYLHKSEDFKFLPNVFSTLQEYLAKGYLIIIITNQAGIGRGYYTEHDFDILTQWMLQQFAEHNISISGVYYCPHHPSAGLGKYKQNCACRKPQPGMIKQAVKEHNIDVSQSILFGDKISDIEAGKNAGIKTNILVETGHDLTQKERDAADKTLISLKFVEA